MGSRHFVQDEFQIPMQVNVFKSNNYKNSNVWQCEYRKDTINTSNHWWMESSYVSNKIEAFFDLHGFHKNLDFGFWKSCFLFTSSKIRFWKIVFFIRLWTTLIWINRDYENLRSYYPNSFHKWILDFIMWADIFE